MILEARPKMTAQSREANCPSYRGFPPINPSCQACGRRSGWSGAETGAQARAPGRARRAVRGGCLE
ncbi:hypothetical protein GCM10010363_54370 [Streptomyces omiyaensis]|nr:hypothetical protein GCM10010363_54370 [Streptomyces omiyaensis]